MESFSYTPQDFHINLEDQPPGCFVREKENVNSEVEVKTEKLPDIQLPPNQPVNVILPNTQKTFDQVLQNKWETAQEESLFRYILPKKIPSRILKGKFNFIAQLNPDRGKLRRKPDEIKSINQLFNVEKFHFNKANRKEILFLLRPSWSASTDENEENAIFINVSPLEYGHVLLVPSLSKNLPQRVAYEGLRMAVEMILLSDSSDLRVGFNSLGGYASVNHQHFHAYYLHHRLYIEYSELKVLVDPCYSQIDYPAPGFVFLLHENGSLEKFLTDSFKLISYLQIAEEAHNVFITRGSSLCQKNHFDSIRLFVWGRSPTFGVKETDESNVALCEFAGHFPMKNEESYSSLTEEFISQELNRICRESFKNISAALGSLY